MRGKTNKKGKMMTIFRKTLLGIAALSMTGIGASTAAFADNADDVLGTWLRPKFGWHVEFAMCEDDASKMCGEVISGEGTDKTTGGPVVGVKMLFNMEKSDDGSKWIGKMYDPKGGGTYYGKVKLRKDGRAKMSGCMMKVMCKSEKWTRVVAD